MRASKGQTLLLTSTLNQARAHPPACKQSDDTVSQHGHVTLRNGIKVLRQPQHQVPEQTSSQHPQHASATADSEVAQQLSLACP